jgi:hypothetical protein
VYRIKKPKIAEVPTKGCRAIMMRMLIIIIQGTEMTGGVLIWTNWYKLIILCVTGIERLKYVQNSASNSRN